MITRKVVPIIKDARQEEAILNVDEKNSAIQLAFKDGVTEMYAGVSVYQCLGEIIKKHSDTVFLCKGAKRNVRPSGMSSQMTSGIVAYELVLGKPASRENLVNIFDYDDQDIINDPQLQRDYLFLWVDSLRQNEE